MSSSQPHKRVTLRDIEYSISEEDKTASVTKYKGKAIEIIIPRSIKHGSKEYIVTIIASGAFECSGVESVSFEPNSELRTIEKEAFIYSALARIQIPAGAVELEDGWCSITAYLIEVEVDRGNARYSSVGGKLVIGKSDIANEDYDTLVFCSRDSIEANIPATIKIIGAYAFSYSALERIQIPSHVTQICERAFSHCTKLSRFEFEPNSELRTIGKEAFSESALARIQIPSHVTQICERAFSNCAKLSRFEFEPNSELRKIGKYAFLFSTFSRIQIPAGAVELEDGWCCGTDHLIEVEVDRGNARYSSVGGKLVIGKSDIANEDYDTIVFCARDSIEANIPATIKIIGAHAFSRLVLASIKIPSHVTQICERAFSNCAQLSRVEFEPNSELRTIGKEAFLFSSLARIQIPSHVKQICEYAFSWCRKLSRFEFEPNSELRTIEKGAFSYSALARIQIPAGVVELEDGWCCGTEHLIEVEVDRGNARYSSVGGKLVIGKSDIANEDYDTLVFCARDSIEANIPATIKIIGAYAFSYSALARIQIPSHVTQICEGAFSNCAQLSRFEFEPNSDLRTIGEEAFSYSALARIKIPSHVTQICKSAFYKCGQLSRIEFEPNSELRTIGEEAFSRSALISIRIPSHVTQIHEDAFSSCEQIQIVEIGGKSLEESIGMRAFRSSKIVMLPAHEKRF